MGSAPLIYIDYSDIDDRTNGFVKILVAKILRINSDVKVLSYLDIDKEGESENWDEIASDAIKKSMITISLITDGYLNQVELKPNYLKEIQSIQDSVDRYYFPIILKPTKWIDTNWLYKSRLYPSNSAMMEIDSSSQEQELSLIVSKIEGILKGPKIKKVEREKEEIASTGSQDVFISHSHEDSDFAELLKLKLEKQGVKSWIDSERLKIGQDWREEIDDAIKKSAAIIVIMTPSAKASEYVTYEWAFAWGNGKRIFPIILKQTQLHPRLESLQYLNFSNKSSRPWNELIESIKRES